MLAKYSKEVEVCRSKWLALALLPLFFAACDSFGLAQSVPSSMDQVNCSDPALSTSALCRSTTGSAGAMSQSGEGGSGGTQDGTSYGSSGRPADRGTDQQRLYVDRAGSGNQARTRQDNAGAEALFLLDPITDLQRLARSSTGEMLSIFGRDMFQRVPSTFAPADQIPVTADYVVGPGDEVLLRLWGAETFNSQLTVDTGGSIFVPRVGAIHVAGLRADELQKKISSEVSHIYRNYNLSVNLGHLRSIQVYVVGEARRPGAYTISSLSTVLNALFVSGGPNVQGSLRGIQVRRDGQPAMDFDLYDLVLRGDKSRDVRLQQGDTIFIPAAGPQVALAGSVRHPAIFELRGSTTIADLLQYAGGFTSTASNTSVSVERIDVDQKRKAVMVAMDQAGRSMALRDGDVLFVNHISPAYEQSVTIRGNLANPGRFAWHAGMRLNEIIPDRMSLLTNDYWRERNQLGVPVPLFEPMQRNQGSGVNQPRSGTPGARDAAQGNSSYTRQVDNEDVQNSNALRADATALAMQNAQLPSPSSDAGQQTLFEGQSGARAGAAADPTPVQIPGDSGSGNAPPRRTSNQRKIEIPTPEIDWSYAVIERLDPNTLKSVLVPFNPGRLVQDHDPAQNLELQPGDIVTILSQADIPVPLDEQTKYVRLEGEFGSAGVYSVGPNETLDSLVRRAGGLSAKAYLYGSNFLRESARMFQQERLDEYISTLATDMERAAAVRAASSATGVFDPNAIAEQRTLIAQLRRLRATGRIVLEFQPTSTAVEAIPALPLENGDVFRVPFRPNTVSVIGAVYGQNVFLYDPTRRVEDYIALAGKPNRIADRKHAFIIRADGSIFSRERAQGVWSNTFSSTRINPGDAIVVPEKLIKPTALRELLDYSQILSSFGLAAAAINVVR